VLATFASHAKAAGLNIIAVAPTHKAAAALRASGFNKCDTIKGFLFKMYNAKVDLPLGSIIVIDEAAMVSNADYLEIFWLAANRGRKVADCFFKGDAQGALEILEQHDRLKNFDNKDFATEGLLRDWEKSRCKLKNRLILTVKNADVDLLNHYGRVLLKANGIISGKEYFSGIIIFMLVTGSFLPKILLS
jgi:hypothetical protein